MKKVKLLGIFGLGCVSGCILMTYLYSMHYKDELLASELSYLYLPINDFVTSLNWTEKQKYCIEYQRSKIDSEHIKKLIDEVNERQVYSSTLTTVSIYAGQAVENFEDMKSLQSKYDCDNINDRDLTSIDSSSLAITNSQG
ncbi:hypothetical protein [Thalassotalea mangrovi]|uniref:Uncharacterized protein n=1 Tax=Thalassotalea mangrovi TaxID=2572245 RepID=A0A4U1B2J6_9GAMM|nr:hypothetical protein [Thalassotalea mangrovi]TKB43720.1 hypothetical protein E8M12_13925 [Thalassotalea mangrovi]